MALAAVLSAVLVFTANLQLVVLAMVGVGLLAVLYVNPAWGIILVILLQTIKRTFAVFVGMVPFLTVNRLLVIWVFFAILTQRFTTSEKLRFYSHPMNAFIALYSIWILITSILAVNYVYTVAFIPIMIGNLVLLFLLCISGLAADIGRRRSGAAVFGTKHLGEEARAGTLGVGQANSFAVLIVLLLVIIGVLLWWKHASRWTRVGLIGSFMFYLFFLTRTYSRTGMMLTMMATVTFMIYFRRRLSFKKILIGALIALLVLSIFVSDKVIDRFVSIAYLAGGVHSEDTSIRNRWGTLLMASSIVAKYPVFGVGPGNYIYMTSLREYRHLVRGLRRQGGQVMAHNMYAQVIGELGIPGFLLFMYMLYLAWHDLAICRRRLIQSEGILLWCLVHGMNIGWPFYLMGAFTLDMAYDKGFWFILAIPIIVRRLLQGQEQGETSRSGLIRPAA